MDSREKLSAVVFLTVLMVLSQGCANFFYRVSDIRNNMNDFSRKLDETAGSVDQFQNDQWDGYHDLVRQIDDTTKEPYPQLFSSLQKISAAAGKLKAYPPALIDIRSEFEDFVGDKVSIGSGTPEWDTLKPINAKYTSLVDEFNDLVDEANNHREDITDIESDYSIGKLNAGEMKKQVNALLTDIERRKASFAEKNHPKISEIESTYNEMKKLFEEISSRVGEKTEIWVAPGSYVYVRFEEIKKKGEEIKTIISAKR